MSTTKLTTSPNIVALASNQAIPGSILRTYSQNNRTGRDYIESVSACHSWTIYHQ